MFKKILPTFVLISVLAVLALPLGVSAQVPQPPTTCTITRDLSGIYPVAECEGGCVGSKTVPKNVDIEKCGMCCLLMTLYNITDWIFVILLAVAGIMVILGAFNLITSTGEPAKVTSGRNYIIFAAIGLAIAFLAKAIPNIAKMLIGA